MSNAQGTDVSKWQNDISTPQVIDFAKMVAGDIVFTGIKVSQGNWADRDYSLNWENAHKASLPRLGYHYLDWRYGPTAQGHFFAGMLKNDGGEILPVADYEMRMYNPGRYLARTNLKTFVNTVEQDLGREVMIYTSPSFWKEFGSPDDPFFAARKLWIANYYVNAPVIPAPWTRWTFWQYTDLGDGLSLGAESKELDMNWYNGTKEALYAEFNIALEAIPVPEPEPIPAGCIMTVSVETLNLRAGPNTTFPDIGDLHKGDQFIVDSVAGANAWAHGKTLDGREGWAAVQINSTRYMV